MTFKKVVFYIAIIAVVGIVGYQLMHTEQPAVLPEQPAPAPVITSTMKYSCEAGASITAAYSDQAVSLKLSDNRAFDLPQTISADGLRYEKDGVTFVTKGDQAFFQENGLTTIDNCIADNESPVVNGVKTYINQGKTFSFMYPQEFSLVGGGIGYTETWKVNQDATLGMVLAALMTPEDYQPKTNFGDARVTVGTSSDPAAVKGCLVDSSGQGVVKSKVTINNVPFTKFVSIDAGAGNRYETNSFRTVQNNQCYAIEYTIHYVVLENFDPKSDIKAFDQKKMHDILDGIVNSFTFLPQ